jgi:Tfp pilus assembly protein PilP
MKKMKALGIQLGRLALIGVFLATSALGAQKSLTGPEGARSKAAATKKAAFPLPSVAQVHPSAEDKGDVRLPERDPFRALVVRQSDEPLFPVVPGKRGIRVRQLQLKGIVKADGHYLAVMDTRQSTGTLLFRENDEVSDGRVVSITEDSVQFEERSVDPLGKPYWRDVVKKISGSGGVIP